MFYKSGVYCIQSKLTNRVYVGMSTRSLVGRLARHKRELKSNSHCNKMMQDDWNLTKGRGFLFKELFRCDPDECRYYEALLLKEAINQGYEVFNIIKSPFKDLEQKIEERRQNYLEFLNCEPGEDIKVTILKQELSKLK